MTGEGSRQAVVRVEAGLASGLPLGELVVVDSSNAYWYPLHTTVGDIAVV